MKKDFSSKKITRKREGKLYFERKFENDMEKSAMNEKIDLIDFFCRKNEKWNEEKTENWYVNNKFLKRQGEINDKKLLI